MTGQFQITARLAVMVVEPGRTGRGHTRTIILPVGTILEVAAHLGGHGWARVRFADAGGTPRSVDVSVDKLRLHTRPMVPA